MSEKVMYHERVIKDLDRRFMNKINEIDYGLSKRVDGFTSSIDSTLSGFSSSIVDEDEINHHSALEKELDNLDKLMSSIVDDGSGDLGIT